MKILSGLLALSLTLAGVSGTPLNLRSPNLFPDLGMMLESRANGKMPTYNEVMMGTMKKYPGMKVGSNKGRFRYDLKPCDDKCENKKQVKDDQGNCKDCPKNQKPNADQTKCVPGTTKEQGKCSEGKVLDPAAGGQDANTENPKCVDDDDKKCPEGQIAASRDKGRSNDSSGQSPECGVDEDPDFTCEDSNTYDHKTVKSGKISHRCRSTEKYDKEKKDKYSERVATAKDGAASPEDRDRTAKRQARTGWCFVAMASLAVFEEFDDDLSKMTDDEVDGMYSLWDDSLNIPDPEGDGTIPNYQVFFRAKPKVVIGDGETAGLGGIFGAILRAASGFANNAGSSVKSLGGIIRGTRRAPNPKAAEAASKSSTVSRIFKDDRFLECLGAAATAGAVIARDSVWEWDTRDFEMDIDTSRTPEQSTPAPKADNPIIIKYDRDEDEYFYEARTFYGDDYFRPRRIPYEQCGQPRGGLDNNIVSMSVEGGCCSFYDGSNCEADTHLFDMENRSHGDIQGDHRNAISSWWCTYEAGCAGAPGK